MTSDVSIPRISLIPISGKRSISLYNSRQGPHLDSEADSWGTSGEAESLLSYHEDFLQDHFASHGIYRLHYTCCLEHMNHEVIPTHSLINVKI